MPVPLTSTSINFVSTILELKAKAGTIFHRKKARNLMMGTPRKGDKSTIQNKFITLLILQ